MPGTVTAVDVAVGDAVAAGQRLLVLEAMKMQHPVVAGTAGVVRSWTSSRGPRWTPARCWP
ncbi:acetyl-CoA carboxylase biotin carboxyl carrier protein subunit [Blastococcus brunescens]|uniref:Acetyl-CoA carboxylase biotin carboxyl carrier protein subunit n=1 Tax=Blastococcus brunescens TaxID=1564165 RepID=A0ABZ1AXT9_9ACTN|nr:acetyl-CoA carboxylase biotin carboxyl carrier protein subunit [Blastococcus sp. BMG 8361]WRL63384.1 acetyl-CoA carboxylase biotin carboxyl carrier protein subunit [Blastococcus sp. BMG 8361]